MANKLTIMNGSVYVEHKSVLYNTALVIKADIQDDENLLVTVLCPFCGGNHKHVVSKKYRYEHRKNACVYIDEDIGKGYFIIRLPKLIY